MGFVKTTEELAGIERLLGKPRFLGGRQLKVEFLTDPEVLARLLPPPLEPTAQPLASITVGEWHSNGFGDFTGASLYLSATHEGLPGGYALAMWMQGEPAVMFGREVFGEPKKLATVRLHSDGRSHRATVERGGALLLALEAETARDVEPLEQLRIAFNYRARTAVEGIGLDGPALLTRASFTETVRVRREGQGTIELHGTVHDPLEELPVRSVLGATYSEQDIAGHCEVVASVEAAEFVPYHQGRSDDWLSLDTAPANQGDEPHVD
jgi:acetoacetate decarboxylase